MSTRTIPTRPLTPTPPAARHLAAYAPVADAHHATITLFIRFLDQFTSDVLGQQAKNLRPVIAPPQPAWRARFFLLYYPRSSLMKPDEEPTTLVAEA
jgi:hypothetical protein